MKSQEMIPGWTGRVLESALILLSFSFFTPVMLLAVNAQRGAEPGKFLLVGGTALAIGTLITVVLSRYIGRPRALSMVALFLMWSFAWGQLVSWAGDIPFFQPLLGAVVPILALVVLLGVGYMLGERPEFRLAVLVAGVALVLTPVWTLVRWYSGEPVAVALTGPLEVEDEGPQRDVYFLVVDGYGRADILNEVYGFSNEAFLDQINQSGFFVPESSWANYSMTAASLASTLALDYLVPETTVPDHRLRVALYEVIRGSNPVVEAFRSAGYQYIHVEGGWDGSRCGDNVDVCYPSGFIDEASWTLLARTPLFPYLRSRLGNAFTVNGMRVFEDLDQEASLEREKPRFVFAHVTVPHPPLYLDKECNIRPEPEPGGGAVGARFLLGTTELEQRRSAYVEQVACVNKKVLRFIDDLGDDTLVFITGDHGPDSFGQLSVPPKDWTGDDIRERFSVMSAYRMPPECEKRLNDDEDLINGMRVLVQCALGSKLPSLPQRALIFPTPDGPPNPTAEIDIAILGG